MLRQKLIQVFTMLAILVCGTQAFAFATGSKEKRKATFKVRVENVSGKDGIKAQDGSEYPFALSPGFYAISKNKMDFFKDGKKASTALERLAEDGNPGLLEKKFATVLGSLYIGVFNTPVGAAMPSPIFPGGSFEFEFTAAEGMKLNMTTMYGQSNDLFYAPEQAIDLFENGNPMTGDITDKFLLWDAGTEVNQAPGLGADQGPRQKAANTGAAENGVVRLVNDGFSYPITKDVLRITITAQ